jgi:hypothetical protein
MALATYQNVVDAVRDWLARPNDTTLLTDTRIDDFIVMAEADIYDGLRVRDMETAADLTVSAQTAALPTGYLETRRLYLDGSPLLTVDYMAPSQFWSEFRVATPGRPRAYTIEGANLVFGPAPDATYTGKHLYYRRFPTLSSATNALFTARPNLWVYGALRHAALFVGADERKPVWDNAFVEEMGLAQRASDRGAYSGAPLVIRVG